MPAQENERNARMRVDEEVARAQLRASLGGNVKTPTPNEPKKLQHKDRNDPEGGMTTNVAASELLALFRSQSLAASGEVSYKASHLQRTRKFYGELRGSTLVVFRNANAAVSPALLMRDIVAVLILKYYSIHVSRKQGYAPRMYMDGPGLENGQLLYIRCLSDVQLEMWRNALAVAVSLSLPDLMSMTVESVIGQGGGGKVFLVCENESDTSYALKVINKESTMSSASTMRHVISERHLMELIGQHPFVLPMKFAFQTDLNLFIGTPFCGGGDLATYLKNQMRKHGAQSPDLTYGSELEHDVRHRYGGHLSEDRCRSIAAEILLALEHLHSRGVVYRDLKPENIFIESSGHIRLGDFGLAKHLQESRTGCGFVRTSSICGTRNYLPPEMLFGKLYSFEVDMWSFGVMIFRILCGRFPFEANRTKEVFNKVKRENVRIPSYLSSEARSLLEGLLDRDQMRRLDVAGAKKHPFFSEINWAKLKKKTSAPPIQDVELGKSLLDTLDNFDLSKLEGVTLGEVIPEENERLDAAYNSQARLQPDGKLIGFEYTVPADDDDVIPDVEVKKSSSLLGSLKKIPSLDSDIGDIVKAALSPRGRRVRRFGSVDIERLPDRKDTNSSG